MHTQESLLALGRTTVDDFESFVVLNFRNFGGSGVQ